MIRTYRYRVLLTAVLSGCTPLGLWLYEEPVVTVSRVTLERKDATPSGTWPVIVALAVANRNDYALSAERVEIFLRLDGVPIGTIRRDSTVPVEMAAVSTLALTLVPEKPAARKQVAALGWGTHNFAVRGRATFRTPFGLQKVRFEQKGAMIFGERPTALSP